MPTELEDTFIRLARRSKHKRTGRVLLTLAANYKQCAAFAAAGLVKPDSGGPGFAAHSATPRGLDLLATADAIGYDPDASKPAPIEEPPPTLPCDACDGHGRVPVGLGRARERSLSELVDGLDGGARDPAQADVLDGWDVTCEPCKGSGRVLADTLGMPKNMLAPIVINQPFSGNPYIRRVTLPVPAESRALILTKHYNPTPLMWHDPAPAKACETAPSEWIDFNSLDDVEGWEGATIEVRHRDGDLPSLTRKVTNFIRSADRAVLFYGDLGVCTSGAGWQLRKVAQTQDASPSRVSLGQLAHDYRRFAGTIDILKAGGSLTTSELVAQATCGTTSRTQSKPDRPTPPVITHLTRDAPARALTCGTRVRLSDPGDHAAAWRGTVTKDPKVGPVVGHVVVQWDHEPFTRVYRVSQIKAAAALHGDDL